MRFCRYYSTFLEAYGIPTLSLEQYQKLFNIISLENKYSVLEDISAKLSGTELSREVEIKKYRIRQKLNSLMGDKYPKDVLKELINSSGIN